MKKGLKVVAILVFLFCSACLAANAQTVFPAAGYQYKVLIKGLYDPEDLAISPLTDKVYFSQDAAPLGNGKGNSQGVYELKDGKAIFRFPGAGDEWGNVQSTKICCGYSNEIYIYTFTYVSECLTCRDIKNGYFLWDTTGDMIEDKVSIEIRRAIETYKPIEFNGMLVNSQDKRLYIDKEWKDLIAKKAKGKVVGDLSGASCVDNNGIFYRLKTVTERYEIRVIGIEVVKPNQSVKELKLQDIREITGKDGTVYGKILRYNPATDALISVGMIEDHKAIFSINPQTGKVSRIASIYYQNGTIDDLEVDKHGNIYFLSSEYNNPTHRTIVKISKS